MIDNLTIGWKALTAAGTAMIAIIGGSWGLFEYEAHKAAERQLNSDNIEVVASSVQRLKDNQQLERWAQLNTLRRKVGLGLRQYKEWCILGQKLFENFRCPPYDSRRPRND